MEFDVKHIAKLAMPQFTAEEAAAFEKEFAQIVKMVENLPEVSTKSVEMVFYYVVELGAWVLAFLLVLFICAILRYGKRNAVPFGELTAAVFAGVVFPAMLSCLLLLRMEENGRALVFLPLCISFGSDTFALFAGMLCGKHKLAPKVSPKKTVEGAIGA